MKSILVLWKNNMKLMAFKSISKFLVLVIAPVIIAMLFINFMPTTSGLSIGIVDNDKSISSEHIIDVIKQNPHFNIVKMEDSQVKEMFANNKVQAVVSIGKEFEKNIIDGEKAKLKMVGKEGDSTQEMLEGMINPYIRNLEDLGLASSGDKDKFNRLISEYQKESLVIEMKLVGEVLKNYGEAKIIIGFLMMLILYKAFFGAERINKDKKAGVFSRVILSGVSSFKYYLGNILASLSVLVIQVALTLIFIKLIMKLDMGMSYLEVFFILVLTSIFAVALGTVCVSLTKNAEEASIIGNIVIVVSLMIGGAFMPVEIFPEFAAKISKLTPIRWLTDMITNLQLGSTISQEWKGIVLILCCSGVMLLISGFVTNQKDKKFVES